MTTAGGRGPQMWDERYGAAERVWSSGPNREVERIVAGWVPGRALDLGAGEGRHALWLAEKGWQVMAVDFTTWHPPEGTAFDLVLVAYLHIPEDVFSRLGRWLAPGGDLVVVGHALRNLTEGVGGPQDPALLHTTEQLRAAAQDLDVERCEEVLRSTDAGDAIDVVLVARRPAG